MLLRGSLKEYPLSDLLAILAMRGETGRLDVGSETSVGRLYLKDGQMVECRMGVLQGADALEPMLSLTEGSFSFCSGVIPAYLAIGNRATSKELAALLRTEEKQLSFEIEKLPASVEALGREPRNALASLNSSSPYANPRYKGLTVVMVLMAVAVIIGMSFGSEISNKVNGPNASDQEVKSDANPPTPSTTPSKKQQTVPYDIAYIMGGTPTASPETSVTPAANSSKKASHAITTQPTDVEPIQPDPEIAQEKDKADKVLSIPVVLQIEDGRVVEAYPAKHHPGWEAYEATAVRLARQRRFANKTGTETLSVTVSSK